MTTFMLYSHMAFSLCVHIPGVSSSPRDTCHVGLRAHLNGFILTYLFKGPVTKYSYILSLQGLVFQHMNLGGIEFSPSDAQNRIHHSH